MWRQYKVEESEISTCSVLGRTPARGRRQPGGARQLCRGCRRHPPAPFCPEVGRQLLCLADYLCCVFRRIGPGRQCHAAASPPAGVTDTSKGKNNANKQSRVSSAGLITSPGVSTRHIVSGPSAFSPFSLPRPLPPAPPRTRGWAAPRDQGTHASAGRRSAAGPHMEASSANSRERWRPQETP